AVRALVGGRDRRLGPFNRAVQAHRQPGSAFKPFVWAAALEGGIAADSQVSTRPVALGQAADEGPVRSETSLTEALARSDNILPQPWARRPAVAEVAALARRLGVGSAPQKPHLSIALGAYETTLLELTAAYEPFQQGGRRTPPWLVDEVLGSDGRVIW